MSSYVYVLRSAVTGRHHIGSTNDLERRVADYNRHSTRASRAGDAWECVYFEVLDNLEAARSRERYLKSLEGITEKIDILYTAPTRRKTG